MRKVIYPVVVFVFCALALFAQDKKDEVVWDFGKVKEGDVVKHEFMLKNESAKKLKIISVSSSCGCTASAAKKKSLEPGESTAIEVSFKSAKYSGDVTQVVYVDTDDADNALKRFVIKANVVKDK